MKHLIIGYGFVGKATYRTLKSLDPHCEIVIHDPNLGHDQHPLCSKVRYDFIFICVPTPLSTCLLDGIKTTEENKLSCDIVEDVYDVFMGQQVIRSTVTPEFVQNHDECILWPEFFREETWADEASQPNVMDVVGVPDWMQLGHNHFHDYLRKFRDVRQVTPMEACIFKLARNAFLATKVTFANMLKNKCDFLGVNYTPIRVMMKHSIDPLTHWDVPGPDGKYGFGGKCLPKDTTQFGSIDNDFLTSTILHLNKIYRDNDS